MNEHTPSAAPARAAPPHERRPLALNATWRLGAVVVRVLVGVVSVALFTRILGIGQWGLLALFQAAVAPLALLEGLGTATTKFAAEALGRGDREGATAVVQTTVVLNALLGAAGVVALAAAAPWLAGSVFAIPPADVARAVAGFRAIAVVWLFTVASTTYAAALAAHQRYDLVAWLGTGWLVASTGAGLLAAWWTRSIVWVLVAQGAGAAAVALVTFRLAVALLPGLARRPRLHAASLRRSGRFWSWQLVSALGGLGVSWADRYLLGAWFAPAVVGFYAVAQTLQAQLYAAFYEMGEVLFPAVSDLEGRGDLPTARRLSVLVGWTLTSAFGACAGVLAVVGGDFLHLWIGPEAARQATAMLRLLCVAGMAGMAALAPLKYVLGVGRTRWDAASSLTAGLIVLGTGLALVPRYGLLGVGYGLLAAALARWVLVLFIWRVHFRPGVPLGRFAAHTWTPPLISLLVTAPAVVLHDRWAHAHAWPRFFAEALLAAALLGAAQLGLSLLVPGGRARVRDVVGSLLPVARGGLRALRRA